MPPENQALVANAYAGSKRVINVAGAKHVDRASGAALGEYEAAMDWILRVSARGTTLPQVLARRIVTFVFAGGEDSAASGGGESRVSCACGLWLSAFAPTRSSSKLQPPQLPQRHHPFRASTGLQRQSAARTKAKCLRRQIESAGLASQRHFSRKETKLVAGDGLIG